MEYPSGNSDTIQIAPGVWLVYDTDNYELRNTPLSLNIPDNPTRDHFLSLDLVHTEIISKEQAKITNLVNLRSR